MGNNQYCCDVTPEKPKEKKRVEHIRLNIPSLTEEMRKINQSPSFRETKAGKGVSSRQYPSTMSPLSLRNTSIELGYDSCSKNNDKRQTSKYFAKLQSSKTKKSSFGRKNLIIQSIQLNNKLNSMK